MTIRSAAIVLILVSGLACRQTASTTPGDSSAKPVPPTSGATAQAPAVAQAPPGSGGGPTGSAPGGASPPAAKPVPPSLPAVVARVNGEPISGPELEQAIRNLEAGVGQPVPLDRRDGVYRQMLDELIGFKLLVQAASAERLTVADSELDGRLAQIRQQFPSEQAFLDELKGRNMTLEQLRRQIQSQLRAAKVVEKHIEPVIVVGDKDVATFYEQNKSQFLESEAVHASHILIRADEKADEATKKAARAQAEQVLARARKGEDFAALAREYSQDSGSSANGGDLGFVAKGKTVPAFETAAFALKPGELSAVVQTPFGFHVIKAAEHRQARQVPLAEAGERIKQYLTDQRRQERTAALVGGLRAKAKVDILI